MIDLNSTIIRLKQWAEANPLVRSLLIYGSYAKGTADPASDLDIALVIWPDAGDPDAGTTWIVRGTDWEPELRTLVHSSAHLEWFDVDGGETPTIESALKEARIVVYGYDPLGEPR